jgi:hypothetical protein
VPYPVGRLLLWLLGAVGLVVLGQAGIRLLPKEVGYAAGLLLPLLFLGLVYVAEGRQLKGRA